MAKVAITDLLEAGCHFGHQTRRWNPKMKDYVYGAKNGISIIDLGKTMYQINAACNFLQNIVIKGGDILFVGTKRQAREITKALAERTGMYHVSERWLGGTLTNNVTIRKSINKMFQLDEQLASDAAGKMKKKELSMLTRTCDKLHRDLDGIAEMKKLPAALVVIDVCHEINAVREANKLNIPIVALVDTNADPTLIDYPVAANDDAVKSIQIVTDLFADAVALAKEVYQKRVIEEKTARGAAEKAAADESGELDKKPRRSARPAAKAKEEAVPAEEKAAAPAEAPEKAPAATMEEAMAEAAPVEAAPAEAKEEKKPAVKKTAAAKKTTSAAAAKKPAAAKKDEAAAPAKKPAAKKAAPEKAEAAAEAAGQAE